jgi:hypothetical protein
MKTATVVVYKECIVYDFRHNADISGLDTESIKV